MNRLSIKSRWLFAVWVIFIFGALGIIGFVVHDGNTPLLWIIEGVSVLGVVLSVWLYYRLIKPYQVILSGMELLKEQDFSTTLRAVRNSDVNQVIGIFNRMIEQLRRERLQVREKNRFLDLLIQASPQGIIIMDYDFRITDINLAGMKMLHVSELEAVRGKTFGELELELAPALAAMQPGDDQVVRDSGMLLYRCIRSSFFDQGFDHPFILMEELTRELLKVEKTSYERIIRMMSHEVNNSVGAIGSTLNVVSDVFGQVENDEWKEILPAVNASLTRCDHLAQFISNLAEVVKIPQPSLAYISLNEQARSVDALTRMECHRRSIRLTLDLSVKDCLVQVDGIQFEQVLVNIVKNACESIGSEGEIRITTCSNPKSIRIEDNGPGISPEAEKNLFMPFFTTKKTGQGIGLMFVREVLTNHHCRFSLTMEEGWTRFQIHFPVS